MKKIILSRKFKLSLVVIAILVAMLWIPFSIVGISLGVGYGGADDPYAMFILILMLLGVYISAVLFVWGVWMLILYLIGKLRGLNNVP